MSPSRSIRTQQPKEAPQGRQQAEPFEIAWSLLVGRAGRSIQTRRSAPSRKRLTPEALENCTRWADASEMSHNQVTAHLLVEF
jgi:hypothetical protein